MRETGNNVRSSVTPVRFSRSAQFSFCLIFVTDQTCFRVLDRNYVLPSLWRRGYISS
jgi:hypothetical protein